MRAFFLRSGRHKERKNPRTRSVGYAEEGRSPKPIASAFLHGRLTGASHGRVLARPWRFIRAGQSLAPHGWLGFGSPWALLEGSMPAFAEASGRRALGPHGQRGTDVLLVDGSATRRTCVTAMASRPGLGQTSCRRGHRNGVWGSGWADHPCVERLGGFRVCLAIGPPRNSGRDFVNWAFRRPADRKRWAWSDSSYVHARRKNPGTGRPKHLAAAERLGDRRACSGVCVCDRR